MEEPIALYIPCCPELDDLEGRGGGSLFIMDRRIVKQPELEIHALVYRKPSPNLPKCWVCDFIPPQPLCIPPDTDTTEISISSYALLVKGDTTDQICISVDGVVGTTYCLDTASCVWSELGKWTLPFKGKVEYVPEMKLWFGFSPNGRHFAAADLSAIMPSQEESQPQLLYSWKELEPPQGWEQMQDPQLVNLGSGRFCIARFIHTSTPRDGESGGQSVTVLTGVEFPSVGNGIVNLGLVKRQDTITAVL